jgi:glutaredoxin
MIEIYGKPNCAMCTAAKQLLDNNGIPYTYKTLGEHFTREELLEKVPQAREFPQIFIMGESIGGFNELRTKVGILKEVVANHGPQALME